MVCHMHSHFSSNADTTEVSFAQLWAPVLTLYLGRQELSTMCALQNGCGLFWPRCRNLIVQPEAQPHCTTSTEGARAMEARSFRCRHASGPSLENL